MYIVTEIELYQVSERDDVRVLGYLCRETFESIKARNFRCLLQYNDCSFSTTDNDVAMTGYLLAEMLEVFMNCPRPNKSDIWLATARFTFLRQMPGKIDLLNIYDRGVMTR